MLRAVARMPKPQPLSDRAQRGLLRRWVTAQPFGKRVDDSPLAPVEPRLFPIARQAWLLWNRERGRASGGQKGVDGFIRKLLRLGGAHHSSRAHQGKQE